MAWFQFSADNWENFTADEWEGFTADIVVTQITNYIINRTHNFDVVNITIGDSYPWYQVYIDNILTAESPLQNFSFRFPINKKIDVLGTNTWDYTRSYSSILDDSNGDKMELLLDATAGFVNFYGSNSSGLIDYGKVLNSSPIDLSKRLYGSFGLGPFGQTTFGLSQSGFRKVFITPRQTSGTYSVAVVSIAPNSAYYHSPLIATTTISTRPNEIIPSITNYIP
jgi:hypothetical protein